MNDSNAPNLDGQVAIVTGGGQGLGQALCHRLAQAGATVVVADVNPATANATAAGIRQQVGRATLACAVDVTAPEQVAALVEQVCQALGRIDLLVANAGIVVSGSALEFATDQWRQVIDVNLTGYFLCVRQVAPVMKAQRSGAIVQINSISGLRGSLRNPAYCASKAAGIGLTQSLALELAAWGIRVNAVCPGHLLASPLWVNSLFRQYAARYQLSEAEVRAMYIDRVPMKRACTYDDVGDTVVFLASARAGYLTGQAISVNGGQVMR